jgi:hypothetical protein
MLDRFEQLKAEAIKLRKQAEGMPQSIQRDQLLRKADQMDVATRINEWLSSPSLQAPQ